VVFLEGVLMRRFVQSASDADIAGLEAIADDFVAAATKDDVTAAVSLMSDFYAHITRVAQSEVVADVLSQLTARVSVLRSTTMSQPGRMAKSIKEIGSIMTAIVARDADKAEKAAVEHVRSAAAAALNKLAD
jgi:DNA-binding GntR family transcriptional regulator